MKHLDHIWHQSLDLRNLGGVFLPEITLGKPPPLLPVFSMPLPKARGAISMPRSFPVCKFQISGIDTLPLSPLCHLDGAPVSWASKNINIYKFKICFLVVTLNIEEKINPFIPPRPQVHFRKYIFRQQTILKFSVSPSTRALCLAKNTGLSAL